MAGSFVGAGLGALFGDEPDISSGFPGFGNLLTPAFEVDRKAGGNFAVSFTPEFAGAVEDFKRAASGRANEIGDLLPLVKPGMGALTAARLAKVREARERSVGEASSNFQRRNVLGSSFGQAAIGDIERAFGRDEAEVAATSFLEELALTNELQRERTQTLQGALSTEMNARLGVSTAGANVVTSMQNIMSQNARFLSELRVAQSVGTGQLLGQLGSDIGGFLLGSGGGGIFDFEPIKIPAPF